MARGRMWYKEVNTQLTKISLFSQENLLFDEYHKVKLIDFGLCAKPKVSTEIKTHLFPL